MGTVPMGMGEAAMMALRMAGISPPVERSMTVSAPYLMEYWSFSSSPSTLETTEELPMFELILHVEATPMHMGSRLVDRKSTRLNSSHLGISYAVFCLKKIKWSSC